MRNTQADVDYHLNRGYAKAENGEYTAAISDYDTAIHINPNDSYAYVLRGIAKEKLGNYESAVSDFDTAISLDPEAIYYFFRGQLKATLEQYEAAISDFDITIKLKGGKLFAIGYYERGVAKYHLGKYEDSISDFDAQIREIENHTESYLYRALAKIELNQIDSAKKDLHTVSESAFKQDNAQLKNEIKRYLQHLKKLEIR